MWALISTSIDKRLKRPRLISSLCGLYFGCNFEHVVEFRRNVFEGMRTRSNGNASIAF